MLWTSTASCRAVEALTVGDVVLNIDNEPVMVSYKDVHHERMCNIVELGTRAASLQVSESHRVVIPAADGSPSDERQADRLQRGDMVFCGDQPQRLVRDPVHHRMRTALVELRFSPDQPVPSFNAPRWGIATRGSEATFPDTEDELTP